jgi:hypothetical protein
MYNIDTKNKGCVPLRLSYNSGLTQLVQENEACVLGKGGYDRIKCQVTGIMFRFQKFIRDYLKSN